MNLLYNKTPKQRPDFSKDLPNYIIEQNPNSATKVRKYSIINKIGRGQFSICLKIRDDENFIGNFNKNTPKNNQQGKFYACKIYSKTDNLIEINSDRLGYVNINLERLIKNEIKINSFIKTRLTNHKLLDYIIKLHHVFDDEYYYYLIYDYLSKGSLFDLLNTRKRLSEFEVSIIMKQLSFIIYTLHSIGVVHNSLRAGCLFFGKEMLLKMGNFKYSYLEEYRNERFFFDLNDVVLLKNSDSNNYFCSYYIPDETRCEGWYNRSKDIWCFGVILYLLITGSFPLLKERNDHIVKVKVKTEVSYELQYILLRLLSPNHEDRSKFFDELFIKTNWKDFPDVLSDEVYLHISDLDYMRKYIKNINSKGILDSKRFYYKKRKITNRTYSNEIYNYIPDSLFENENSLSHFIFQTKIVYSNKENKSGLIYITTNKVVGIIFPSRESVHFYKNFTVIVYYILSKHRKSLIKKKIDLNRSLKSDLNMKDFEFINEWKCVAEEYVKYIKKNEEREEKKREQYEIIVNKTYELSRKSNKEGKHYQNTNYKDNDEDRENNEYDVHPKKLSYIIVDNDEIIIFTVENIYLIQMINQSKNEYYIYFYNIDMFIYIDKSGKFSYYSFNYSTRLGCFDDVPKRKYLFFKRIIKFYKMKGQDSILNESSTII